MAQTSDPAEGVGARIEEFRKIRGLSQHQLGRQAHVSQSYLSKIENGSEAASPDIVAAVARALGVSVSVLRGQPYITMLQADELDALLSPIASSLEAWDIEDDGHEPRALDDLETEVTRVVGLRLRTEMTQVAEVLPGLITEVTSAVLRHDDAGRDRERAHALQAEVARTAASLAYRLGFPDLARLAVSRMAAAAAESGDPRLLAIERFERAEIGFGLAGRPDRGVALMRRALRELDDDGSTTTRAVRGILLLRGATVARRDRRPGEANDLLGEAQEVAQLTGDVEVYALAFGPLWVQLSTISDLNDASDHEGALRVARDVRLPQQYSPNRTAHYWINRARSEAWTAHTDDAFESLCRAREAAPQMTRYHPEVHETVSVLLRARRRADEALRQFAEWSGV